MTSIDTSASSDTFVTASQPPQRTDEILGRIHEIGGLLSENAVVSDQERNIPDATFEALDDTGAMKISALKKYGGYEGGARMLFDVARTIGTYDPAAAWVTVISNGSVMLANRYDDPVVDEIFADGPVPMASIFNSPMGKAVWEDDGWRLEGEWPFASNCLRSDWAIGLLNVEADAEGKSWMGFALMKRSQFSIKDTWYTIGMRGTGSNTMVTEDLWIPAERLVPFEKLIGGAPEKDPDATFGRRITPHLTMATTIQAPNLGAAQAAHHYVAGRADSKGITGTPYNPATQSSAFVQALGASHMKIEGSLLLLQRAADDIDAVALGTKPMPLEIRAQHRGGIAHAGHELVEAVNDLAWLNGASSFADFSPLGRLWRDVNTGTRHASIIPSMGYELHGDGLTGAEYITNKL